MRYDSEHKERTRQRVLKEAAAAIRAAGAEGVGVAALMAKAGLTHGGFYAHFRNKDDLIAQAIGRMFQDSYSRFAERTEGRSPAAGLAHYIDMYLSPRHRDAPENGCPMPSLSGEVARLPEAARGPFAAGAERLTKAVAGLLRELGRPDPDALAASVVAELVGAMALARATADETRSRQILASSRDNLKKRLGVESAE